MNANLIRLGDMFENAERCIIANPITPPIARATAAQAQLTASISALRAAAESQLTGNDEAAASVDARIYLISELRKAMKEMGNVARSLEPEFPGISEKFRLPSKRSNTIILASVNSMIAAIADYQSAFTDSGITPAYVTNVTDLVADFQAATGSKHDGGNTQVNSTAALKQIARDGLRAAITLDACMRVHFRNDPAILAEWTHARHIKRAPNRQDTTTPPPDGTGSESPTSLAAVVPPEPNLAA